MPNKFYVITYVGGEYEDAYSYETIFVSASAVWSEWKRIVTADDWGRAEDICLGLAHVDDCGRIIRDARALVKIRFDWGKERFVIVEQDKYGW